jgi:hypothetical protein
MISFSFAYDVKEDRICLRVAGGEDMIWFTRRLVVFLLTQGANRFAESATAGMEGWVTPKAPVELEHELAVTEPDDGQVGSPVQIAAGKFDAEAQSQAVLCERITLTSHSAGVQIALVTGDGQHTVNLSRAGFHRFLRALLLVANRVAWDLPEVPTWLSKNYLPSSIQGVVDTALHSLTPPDLNEAQLNQTEGQSDAKSQGATPGEGEARRDPDGDVPPAS